MELKEAGRLLDTIDAVVRRHLSPAARDEWTRGAVDAATSSVLAYLRPELEHLEEERKELWKRLSKAEADIADFNRWLAAQTLAGHGGGS